LEIERRWFVMELTTLKLERIKPNRLNPRFDINIERLNELADSIKQVGLLEPIIVRPIDEGFEVVVGERRYRASQQAGLQDVPAIIQDLSDEQVIELNLIENIQREDLSAVEKGNCCRHLLEKYQEKYPSRETIAAKIGVSADTIGNWLKLTEAPLEIKKMIIPLEKAGIPRPLGKLDYNTALTITRQIEEPAKQVEVAEEIAKRPLHGRKARQAIAKVAHSPEKPIEEILQEAIEGSIELTFAATEKELILKKVKIQTTTIETPDPQVKAGKTAIATILEPHFADLKILSVERKRLKYFNDTDAKAEGYLTMEEFKEAWIKKYDEWNENQLVFITHFKKV
jgi:ParB family chromosome partitioning protein